MINKYEAQYRNLLSTLLKHGVKRESRTGPTIGMYNLQLKAELTKGFPMLTGRRLFWKNIKWEAEWMLRGDTNIQFLNDHDVHIWDQWADENGDLGPTYGAQLHKQWVSTMYNIIKDPYSRRHVINLWNVEELPLMRLPPCYYALQFYFQDYYLNLIVTSRSSDAAIGLPYDMGVCAYFLHVACKETNLNPGRVIFHFCDIHINKENVQPVKQYLEAPLYELPRFVDGEIQEYVCGPSIQMTLKL